MALSTVPTVEHHNTRNGHTEGAAAALHSLVRGWCADHAGRRAVNLCSCEGPVRPLCERLRVFYLGDRITLCADRVGAVAAIYLSDLCDPAVEGDTLSLDFENGQGWLVLEPGESFK